MTPASTARSLTGLVPDGGALKLVFSDERQRIGRVEALDASGRVAESAAMQDVTAAIPCFTPGCALLTDSGLRQVGDFAVGDRVATRDNGFRPILWIGTRRFDWRALGLNPLLRPVVIQAGALGGGLPEREMTVSPNHRILFVARGTDGGREEAFVPARDLTSRPGITVASVAEVTYVQVLFSRHEVVMSEGLWSESFQAQDGSIAALGPDAATELGGILGRTSQGSRTGYEPARGSVAEPRVVSLAT